MYVSLLGRVFIFWRESVILILNIFGNRCTVMQNMGVISCYWTVSIVAILCT